MLVEDSATTLVSVDTSTLPAGRFQVVEWVESTASTNADLAEAVRSGLTDARVLLTEEQTAGRGRRDRTWTMPPGGGLLMSMYVPWPADDAAIVATALGVAAVDAIGGHGVPVALKWPNDLLLPDGRKVAGMLGERVATDSHVGVVVGMGLNVSWPTIDDGFEGAGCLNDANPEPIDRPALARTIITNFDEELRRVEHYGSTPVLDRYRVRCATLGTEVRVQTPSGDITGRAIDIDESGRLRLETTEEVMTIDVGDVVHLRPQ